MTAAGGGTARNGSRRCPRTEGGGGTVESGCLRRLEEQRDKPVPCRPLSCCGWYPDSARVRPGSPPSRRLSTSYVSCLCSPGASPPEPPVRADRPRAPMLWLRLLQRLPTRRRPQAPAPHPPRLPRRLPLLRPYRLGCRQPPRSLHHRRWFMHQRLQPRHRLLPHHPRSQRFATPSPTVASATNPANTAATRITA
jgi:hypothetical protein